MYTTFGSPVGFVGICTALFVMTSLWEDETFELVIFTPRFWCRRVVVKEEEDEFFLEDKEEEDFCCCTNTCCEADKDEDIIIVIQVFAKERVFTTACVRVRMRVRLLGEF